MDLSKLKAEIGKSQTLKGAFDDGNSQTIVDHFAAPSAAMIASSEPLTKRTIYNAIGFQEGLALRVRIREKSEESAATMQQKVKAEMYREILAMIDDPTVGVDLASGEVPETLAIIVSDGVLSEKEADAIVGIGARPMSIGQELFGVPVTLDHIRQLRKGG